VAGEQLQQPQQQQQHFCSSNSSRILHKRQRAEASMLLAAVVYGLIAAASRLLCLATGSNTQLPFAHASYSLRKLHTRPPFPQSKAVFNMYQLHSAIVQVIGNVSLGQHSSIWYGAILRGEACCADSSGAEQLAASPAQNSIVPVQLQCINSQLLVACKRQCWSHFSCDKIICAGLLA
jgi:predicted nucleic acid-binding Zn ribbon protein